MEIFHPYFIKGVIFLACKITEVEHNSIACKNGISPCDTLLKINGHDIADVLDYRFYMTENRIDLSLLDNDGKPYSKIIKKPRYGDLGLGFETYLMDSQRFCQNKCVFCFIDQMPEGLRESLYFKDDDSRLGFLFGNYITLTNLSDDDVKRIIKMKISPVNISVHTMNPDLRVKMMKNPKAGRSLSYIKQLTDANIKVNAQLVLCPGINDGDELDYSLTGLLKLAPDLNSIAVVPVGLTKHRQDLERLRLFTKAESIAVIRTVKEYQKANLQKFGARICYPADEFYLNAKIELPDYESYEEFDQLENGVGLLALLRHEFFDALGCEDPCELKREVTIATGTAAKSFMDNLAAVAMKRFSGLKINVIAVENRFFGESVTVAGLVTGGDLIDKLNGKVLGQVLIPAVMLRHEDDLFLDGVSLNDAAARLGCDIKPVGNDGYELLDAILGR